MPADNEDDEIIAAYAAGENVDTIAERYQLTRDEIETLALTGVRPERPKNASPQAAPAGTPPPSNRDKPPVTIVCAAASLAIGAVAYVLLAATLTIISIGDDNVMGPALSLLLIAIFLAVIVGFVAHGLWRGTRGSRIAAIIIGVGLMFVGGNMMQGNTGGLATCTWVYGPALIILVTVPKSSRAWFARASRS